MKKKLGHERRTRIWLGCRQQEATEADLILSRFKGPPLILHNFSKNHKKNSQIFLHSSFQFVLQLRGNSVWRWPVQQPRTRFKAKSYLDFETYAFKLLSIKKSFFFQFYLQNFQSYCFPGWDYFQSLYYCFITLTTIGFGDFVALQQEHSLTRSPGYVVTRFAADEGRGFNKFQKSTLTAIPFVNLFPESFCFLLWGLSAVASSVNLLVLKFMTISLEEVSFSVNLFQKGRNKARIKHHKNCECCPGHPLIVNHYSSMSIFKFRNLSVKVNCVTQSLCH